MTCSSELLLNVIGHDLEGNLCTACSPVSAVSAAGLTPRFKHCFCPAPTQKAEDNALRANIGKYGLSHVTKTIDAKEVLESKAISDEEGQNEKKRELDMYKD